MAEARRTLAVLGAGKAGEALISGVLSARWREPDEIVATARHQEHLDGLAERHGIRTTLANAEAAEGAGIVVIGVKPQDIESLLGDIAGTVTPEQTVISIAAAIPTALIERHLADGVPVVRAEEVLSSVGRAVRVDEPYMDAITAVSGSGPAYFELLAESMIEAGILLGLSREISTDLVVQTMLGTAKLLRDEKMHPVELREAVTSPGGTTIAAIRELEQAGVRAAFLNAIQAAMQRSKELAKG